MFKNYLKIGLRHLIKNRLYAVTSVLGLSIGIACSILIMLYLTNEMSYDRHHNKAEQIYRLGAEYTIGGKVSRFANIGRPVGPTLKKDYPEVLEYSRFRKYNVVTGNPVLLSVAGEKDTEIEEQQVYWADSTVFNMFTYQFIQGTPKASLNRPNTAVITESIARKLFGDSNPLGRVVEFDKTERCEITGVIQDPPKTTHLHFEVLISWSTFHTEADMERWLGGHVYTYLLFPEDHDIDVFSAKWPSFYKRYMAETFERIGGSCNIILQPIKDIHLYSDLTWEAQDNGDIIYIYVFAAVGLFILIIASINYVNMATARSIIRAKEVGIRKVAGALRKGLVEQFFSEAVIVVAISFSAAIVMAIAFIPLLNDLTGKELSIDLFSGLILLLGTIAVVALVALIAGLYPAFYLSSFIPAKVLTKRPVERAGGISLRQVLVILQFTISIVIIIGTLVVVEQLTYMKNKDLGFNRENIIAVSVRGTSIKSSLESAKNELLEHPNILKVSISENLPGQNLNMTSLAFESQDGAMEDLEVNFLEVDYEYLDLMGVELVDGRNFDLAMSTDKDQAVIVNQMLVDKFGWSDPIGKKVNAGSETPLQIIGVVNDFHMETLHNEIRPVVMFLLNRPGSWIFLRAKEAGIAGTMDFLEKKWQEFEPNFPLNYVFVSENFRQMYESDEKVSNLFGYCSIIAIFISCLGLLGLSAFTTERRIKEVGIRKVLGASSSNIFSVLSREFLMLVLIANIVGWPLAYYVMDKWLAQFAYQTTMSWWIFLAAGGLAMSIAIFTISFHAIKAALSNPVNSLRYE